MHCMMFGLCYLISLLKLFLLSVLLFFFKLFIARISVNLFLFCYLPNNLKMFSLLYFVYYLRCVDSGTHNHFLYSSSCSHSCARYLTIVTVIEFITQFVTGRYHKRLKNSRSLKYESSILCCMLFYIKIK